MMCIKYWRKSIYFGLIGAMVILLFAPSNCFAQIKPKPRILISSDIGGTDPDDFQSMIHLLMYADLFKIEGLISSPYGNGRQQDFLDIIELYENDEALLRKHSSDFPTANSLRKIVKQGTIPAAPFQGFSQSTEGSEWIVACAKKPSKEPLWVLVWGGLEDLAQALHDEPEIKKNIKVYWIGGPNKKWSINAYAYIAQNHPDLWMIEANATYSGWFLDSESPSNIKNDNYYENFIKGFGAMGKAFENYYKGNLKMGDTPSLTYLMNGNPNEPNGESWGGSFTPINRASRVIFDRNTTVKDTVTTYAEIQWRFKGPNLAIPSDSVCFTIDIQGQTWPGYYLGDGIYAVRYASKKPETGSYLTKSSIPEINGQAGQYISIATWPGKPGKDDYKLGTNWHSDKLDQSLFMEDQQGARTVSKFRSAFLMDWAKRWEWLK
jgi:hypothetical protein